jgi:predicted TIM-barrel fold metal-dependent hydrolase
MDRRAFLSTAAAAAMNAQTPRPNIPVIDCHVHLFDTNRPQGVPWPPKENKALYQPALPDRYRKLSADFGVVGLIEVEASPWLEDNQWVLDLAAKDKFILGMVGNIEPGKPGFAENLERFHKNPLFLGIRYGNLWGSDLSETIVRNKQVIADLKRLSQTGLSLDTANPNPALVAAIVRVTDEVPDLRVVIDHLPQLSVPAKPSQRRVYETHLAALHKRPQVFVKISQIYRKINNEVPRDLGLYKANLDQIFETFGEDRVIFGSDWPNSDNWRPYSDIFSLAREYIMTKGQSVAEKYYWKNSVRAYRWKPREASQPSLG